MLMRAGHAAAAAASRQRALRFQARYMLHAMLHSIAYIQRFSAAFRSSPRFARLFFVYFSFSFFIIFMLHTLRYATYAYYSYIYIA
jgi:hypothetical protein